VPIIGTIFLLLNLVKENIKRSIKKREIDMYLLKIIKFKKFSTIRVVEKSKKIVSEYKIFILN
tara:strand:+ start:304 stop:492 length:189 start_codon:yes stop_codon:yes gene_type:complete